LNHVFSLAHLTVLGCAPPRVVEIAARCGYPLVGLRTIPLGLAGEPRYVLEDDPQLFRETREALRATGVRLLDIEDAIIAPGRDVRSYETALEHGAELGARHVLCNVWGDGSQAFVQNQFDRLCDLAEPLGLKVQCEFVTFTTIATLQDAWALVERSGRANAGVLIDALHFLRSQVALDEIAAVPLDRYDYLQLDDGPPGQRPSLDEMKRVARSERLYVGEGAAPVRQLVERLPGRPLAIEIIHAERVAKLGYEAFAAECLATARRHLESSEAL
jgi:sugar phosphate isomerase/epimerase